MNKINKYRIGVLGLGEGRSIISAAQQSEQWELANICDLNENLCLERMKEFNLDRYTLSYEEMLNDKSIDVVGIYTPDQLHGMHIRMALEAGKHVICTKPVLASLSEAKELIDCAKKYNSYIFVGQSTRFFEPMIHQREDFEKGLHGEVLSVDAHYITDARWFLKKAWSLTNGFSWMYNFMIHAVDLARWYLPCIDEVYGCGIVSSNTKKYGLDCYDNVKFLLKDSEGRFATVGGCYSIPKLSKEIEPSIACTIRGTNGTTRGEYGRLIYSTHFENEGYKTYNYDDKHDYYFRFEGESHHAGEYQNYIEYFAKCLDKGEVPKPDLREAVQTLVVMKAMERSLETGMPVKIKDILKEYDLQWQ